jgi:Ser/Thr protein kinase RdoA (MazF antagonist)
MEEILNKFQIEENIQSITEIKNGLINSTFSVKTTSNRYILQKINTLVFTNPVKLMENMQNSTSFLKNRNEKTIKIIQSKKGSHLIKYKNEYWRVFDFIEKSVNYSKVDNIDLVKESGRTIAHFHKCFYDFPIKKLHITIPNFHNTSIIFQSFIKDLDSSDVKLKEKCKKEINYILENSEKYYKIQNLISKGKLPIRVCHNDPKISNILFDRTGKSICMIDLDTIMPGTILTDFSDAIRTICVSENEEEKNLNKVNFKMDYFAVFAKSYLDVNAKNLNSYEIENLVFSVELMFLEQGIRFLQDHLNGNFYYKTFYKNQNLRRSKNQIHLSKQVKKNSKEMNIIIRNYFN